MDPCRAIYNLIIFLSYQFVLIITFIYHPPTLPYKLKKFTMHNSVVNRIYQSPSLTTLFVCLLLLIQALSLNLVVTPSNKTINSITTYDWNVTSITETYTSVVLIFPTVVALNASGTTAVLLENGAAYAGALSFLGNNITMQIVAPFQTTSPTLFFRVTNIRNPYYYTRSHFNLTLNSNTGYFYLTFDKGTIQSCSLSFLGVTDRTSSTAYLDFTTSNSINNSRLVFKIYYGNYITRITNIQQNGNLMCAFSINGGASFSADVAASYPSAGSPIFDCDFSGANLQAIANVRLRFSNVRNPPFKNNYMADAFRVETLDGFFFYDASSACTLTDVAVDTYEATFTQSSKLVNSIYGSPAIETIQQLSKNFAEKDTIIIDHDGIPFPILGTYIMMSRPGSIYDSIQFNFGSGTENTSIRTQSNIVNTIQQNKRVGIQMTNFNMRMPASITPRNVTFRFLRYFSSNPSLSLQFLNIFATLRPIAARFDAGDLTVTPTTNAIGQKSSYFFRVTISQPLGTNAFILLKLPLQVDLSQFSPTTSTCLFTSSDSGLAPPLCTIANSVNKFMQIDVSSTNGIKADQTLNITIGDIVNPASPERLSFSVETYYTLEENTSQVELGPGIASVLYKQRAMNIFVQAPSPMYTVDYFPSVLSLLYKPGVTIPANLIITFTFNSSISSLISYKNVTVNGITYVYSRSQPTQSTIILTVSNEIPANSTVIFKFEFKAPPSVAVYHAVDVSVGTTRGILYEKSGNGLQITVSFPASEVFALTPLNSTTGVTTTYTLSFYTNVFHPNPFYLSIKFPSDVIIPNINAITCSPSTFCKGVLPISPTGVQEIYLNMTPSTSSSTYTINLTNIPNPRQIGASGPFNLATLTNSTGGNQILTGSVAVSISNPNTASASFDLTKDYYRNNKEPVTISVNFTNNLLFNDFIRVRFDYRTYSLALLSTDIQCSNADILCVYDSQQSTNYTTVIKVIPKSPQALLQPITFTIENLISSSTTFPTQKFQIVIRSYSSQDRQMDQTKLTYNISCANTTTMLAKNCKTCRQQNETCFTCYPGYYLLNSSCVTDCTSSSQYRAYANSTQCVNCINNCSKCISATECISCLTGFYLYENSTCKTQCNTDNAGFYIGTVNGELMCLRCWDQNCIKCRGGGSSDCLNCGSTFMDPSNPGRCIGQCDLNQNYKPTPSQQCLPCNSRCNGCRGPTYSDCQVCRPGFYNISGSCQLGCPQYTVPMADRTCNCSGKCQRCQLIDTRCLSCKNFSNLLYNYQCLDNCPNSTYLYFGQCIDCNTGCLACTVTTCEQCLTGYNKHENRCYSDCNTVGQRYTAINGTCIQCPEGCDFCDSNLKCSVCLGNYTLQGTVCVLTCSLTNTCEKVSPVPDKILPIPGVLTAAIWLAVLAALKLFIIPKLYLPYSYIFLSCIVQLILSLAVLAKMNTTIQLLITNLTSKRLLQTVSSTQVPQAYQYGVLGILAAEIALNYIANAVYLILFCKYLVKYVPDRQIDRISNYAVVVVGMLTNYRFTLLAYSKLFPKPNILVENQSKLTPIHYMCIASILTSFLPLTAACILIYNEYPLTDLFMLGIDLLIIVLLSLIFTIWMVSVDKPEEYFEGMKKYTKEDINNTMEAFNGDKDTMNMSKQKLVLGVANLDNSVINVEDIGDEIQANDNHKLGASYGKSSSIVGNLHTSGRNNGNKGKNVKSDNENDPLPNIPIRSSHINIETMKVKPRNDVLSNSDSHDNQSLEEREKQKQKQRERKKIEQTFSQKKTHRNKNTKTDMKKIGANNEGKGESPRANEHHHQLEKGIKSRNKEAPKNFSKEKKGNNNKKQRRMEDLNIQINELSGETMNNESQYIDQSLQANEPSMNKAQSDIIKKSKKPMKSQTQRSTAILPVTMKKKQSFGVFESEQAASQIDEIDFESLIQTKMIDKTKQKKTGPTGKQEEVQHQEISPSWFNEQNQRFDFQESSDT